MRVYVCGVCVQLPADSTDRLTMCFSLSFVCAFVALPIFIHGSFIFHF